MDQLDHVTARVPSPTTRGVVLACLSFIGVALFQAWPLPLYLTTHLTGTPGGDAGVYVWNIWVFRHELVDLHRWPFSTMSILPLDGPVSLALHNYTVFANLLALPLQSWLGVVTSFNVVYLINVALSGVGMFLLARRVTGRTAEAWIAGAAFACSPFLVARGASHFSLAAAAPLPLFVYFVDRAWGEGRVRDAVAAGVTLAWAAFSDPYYAIYCIMLGVLVFVSWVVVVESSGVPAAYRRRLPIDIAIGALVALVLGVHVAAGGQLEIGPLSLAMRTLYTPMLVLALLVALRLFMTTRLRIVGAAMPRHPFRTSFAIAASAALILAPELYAIARLAADSGIVTAPVPWRSSAPGVDLLSFFVPNPNHPVAPSAVSTWLAAEPGGFDENVMSLSLVGLAAIVLAWRSAGFRPGLLWTVIAIGFASLALGPFVRVAGVELFVPTPWTFLRYVPIIGEARMPQRFGVLAFLGFAVILAGALTALGQRFPERRRWVLAVAAIAMAVELLPVPRRLFAADVPPAYGPVAHDSRAVRVLELPFGIRDGLSSLGNVSAASQFYQTAHGKPLIGGYLSRVDEETKTFYRRHPTLDALLDLSEGRTPAAEKLRDAAASADQLVADARIGYVVIDVGRAGPELRRFAVEAFGLESAGGDGAHELYTPRARSEGPLRIIRE